MMIFTIKRFIFKFNEASIQLFRYINSKLGRFADAMVDVSAPAGKFNYRRITMILNQIK